MYRCTNCDYATTTKLGKCPDCNSFGSFELVPGSEKSTKKSQNATVLKKTTTSIDTTSSGPIAYFYPCKDVAYHRVFSG